MPTLPMLNLLLAGRFYSIVDEFTVWFKLIKWLPAQCADWFFDSVMTWSYCLHRQYSMSQQETAFWLMSMHWTVKPSLYSRFHFCSMEHAWKHQLQKTSHFFLLGRGEGWERKGKSCLFLQTYSVHVNVVCPFSDVQRIISSFIGQ